MPQDLNAFLRQFVTQERLNRFNDVLAERTRHFTLVLDNIFHDHNASACLRTADCFGIQDVHVIESLNAFSPNADVSLGASKWLTTYSYRSSEVTSPARDQPDPGVAANITATKECFRNLRTKGYRILATCPAQDSIPLANIDVQPNSAIVFGSEQLGVNEAVIQEADELIHVPMVGFTESFNVSVSVAIVLHHLTSQVRDSDIDWRLTDDERDILLNRWVRRTLGPKLDPLRRRYYDEHGQE